MNSVVNFLAVADGEHEDRDRAIVDLVDDAVIAYPDAVGVICALDFLAFGWSGDAQKFLNCPL